MSAYEQDHRDAYTWYMANYPAHAEALTRIYATALLDDGFDIDFDGHDMLEKYEDLYHVEVTV